jgi:hypothetical protein
MQPPPKDFWSNLHKAAPVLVWVLSGMPALGIAVGVAAGSILGRTLNQMRKPPPGKP